MFGAAELFDCRPIGAGEIIEGCAGGRVVDVAF